MKRHPTKDALADAPPLLGLRDELRLARHLLLSGWEVREVAAWLGMRPELVQSVCLRALPHPVEVDEGSP
jgi:hypothetical protein